MNNQLIEARKSIWKRLDNATGEIEKSIPSYLKNQLKVDYILRSAKLELSKNPILMKCTPDSICQAVAEATHYGLCIGIGADSYFVPMRNECSFRLSAKGMAKLMIREGGATHISAQMVQEGDEFECFHGTDPRIYHKWNADECNKDRQIICFYAIAFLRNGQKTFVCMSNREIQKIRNFSQSYQHKGENSIWAKHYSEMARKTVIRRLFKYMDCSPVVSELLQKEDDQENGEETLTIDVEEKTKNIKRNYQMNKLELKYLLNQHKDWVIGTKNGKSGQGKRLDLNGKDLTGLDLTELNLSYANLSHTNLNGCDLTGSNLWHVNLQNANLSNANLENLELRFADLKRANLKGSKLENAKLISANLRNADLSGAELSSANLKNTYLENANLEKRI